MDVGESKAFKTFGTLFFAIFFMLSVVYFKERLLAFDPPFFSYLMLQEEWFSVVLGRWGTVFSQVLPLLAIKAGAGLELVLKIYSASFIAIYFFIYLGLKKLDKTMIYPLAFILYLTLFFRETYFYPTAELYIGSALAFFVPFIFNATNERLNKHLLIKPVFIFALYVVASYFHQITIFPFLFLLAFGLKKWSWKNTPFFLTAGLLLLWFILRIKVFTSSSYEANKIPPLSEMMGQIPKLLHLNSTSFLVNFILPKFWWTLGLILISALLAFRQKSWWKFLVSIAFLGAVQLFILLFFYQGESNIMLQNYYSIFGIFIGLPLVHHLHKWVNGSSRKSQFSLVFLALLTVVGICGIHQAHFHFKERLNYVQRINNYCREIGTTKAVVDYEATNKAFMAVSWADAFSSLILSSLDNPDDGSTFYVAKDVPGTMASVKGNSDAFLGPDFSPLWWTAHSLNHKYFALRWTEYQCLNSAQELSMIDSVAIDAYKMEPLPAYRSRKNAYVNPSVHVLLRNWSDRTIQSMPSEAVKFGLHYVIYNRDKTSEIERREFTNLEVDIRPYKVFVQRIEFSKNLKKGSYWVKLSWVANRKPFDKNASWFELQVL